MKNKVIHPFLFAILPLLTVFSTHAGVIAFNDLYLLSGLISFAVLVIFGIFYLFSRNIALSSIFTSALVIAFYSIELPSYLKNISTKWFAGTDGLTVVFFIVLVSGIIFYFRKSKVYKYLLVLSYILLVLSFVNNARFFTAYLLIFTGIIYLIHTCNFERHFNAYLNLISILLLVFSTYTLVQNYLPHLKKTEAVAFQTGGARAAELPDIYYIILDGYGRADVLEKMFDLDNTPFINFLEEKGFYVAGKSTSNYGQTVLALSSVLNSEYHPVDSLLNRELIAGQKIKQNSTFNTLKNEGYKIIAQPSGFGYTDIRDADEYPSFYMLGDFFSAFTEISHLHEFVTRDLNQYQIHRNRIISNIRNLPGITRGHSPALVFSHVIAPHPPFVLGMDIIESEKYIYADGVHFHEFDQEKQDLYRKLFKQQTLNLNKLIKKTIRGILASNETPPIIILQSDHGPASFFHHDKFEESDIYERFSILNAIYFPDQDYSMLYEEISAVNTFRVIFNKYFGMEKDLLEDKKFWSDFEKVQLREIQKENSVYLLLD